MDNIVGKVLVGRYEILERIGEGGMALVYKAKCNLLNRYVAVKVLKSEYSRDENFVRRFRAEAQSAAALTHSNIVSVYDVGEEDGINYIVMELLESKTLKDYIEEHGALSNELTLKIGAQIASALEAAHKSHIIHRDIKPQNIVLNKNMVAKVTDFGIAKITNVPGNTITSFGSTMGSVHYFSPEHAKGGYTDERSDIYSLGVVMYEMATGKLPFDADSPVSVALKQIQEAAIEPIVLNPDISVSLNQIILKAMAKNTIERYQGASDLLKDISQSIARPSALIAKLEASVEAGATQVIPIVDVGRDEKIVPNLRMRQARKPVSVIAAKVEEEKDKESVEEEKEKPLTKDELERKKKRKKIIIIISICIAIFVVGVGIFAGVKISNKIKSENAAKQEIEIPNLVGRPFTEVVEEYSKQNIEILQDKEIYSSEQPEGYVISQTPEKGNKTSSKKVYVVVSKGEKMVEVSDVTGKDIKVATYELVDTQGFKIEIEEVINEKVAAGIIISQDPKEGKVAYGSVIKLKVSKGDGKETKLVPKLVGKTEAEARKLLTDNKLKPSVKYTEDSTKANGVVISQSYPENQELKEDSLVEITVNKLLINKTVNLDLLELQGGTELEVEELKLRVTASIDGGATNTVFEQTYKPTDKKASFSVNGYQKATLKIYINDKLVKEQNIDF